jgi:hypothetical protein
MSSKLHIASPKESLQIMEGAKSKISEERRQRTSVLIIDVNYFHCSLKAIHLREKITLHESV